MVNYHTPENEAKLQKAFSTWDVDGNGFINKKELKRMLMVIGLKDENVDTLFTAMDYNRDNQISIGEFIKYILGGSATAKSIDPVHACKTPEQAMDKIFEYLTASKNADPKLKDKNLFEALDCNMSGNISITEFISGLRSLRIDGRCPVTEHEFPNEVLHEVFNLIDTVKKKRGVEEKDHVLNYKEFKAFMNRGE
eukprot:TRINITY_DN47876_c0_g1_i1.p1 TRINITY_DN47876_c0_g1~~TRINITY_DN47876_c0_g1_i1.p1  ORF type:complete len:195 (+),score=57.11 TRINITY_DN47876_c0_g1_i1:82-666(+)